MKFTNDVDPSIQKSDWSRDEEVRLIQLARKYGGMLSKNVFYSISRVHT